MGNLLFSIILKLIVLVYLIDNPFANGIVAEELKLKVGAQVMLMKNLSVRKGLVNGARGVVVAFDAAKRDFPKVLFRLGYDQIELIT